MTDSPVLEGSALGSVRPFESWIRFGLYPVLWIWIAGCLAYGLTHPEQLSRIIALKSTVMIAVLLAAEWRFPYQRRWGMTWRHLLKRDVIFIAVNGATLVAIEVALVALSIGLAGISRGPLTGAPLWIQVPVALLAFEALQYGLHRWMHQSRGPLTNVMWRAHAIHHLPQQLYLVMHAVFHPINAVLVRLFVQALPIALLGTDPLAVFVSSSIIGYHGTISHFNVDVRAGWANYLFVGPELHRYHHSANSHEAVNYGATLSIFDWMLGTLLYRPGEPPAELGLQERDGYPGQHDPWQSLLLPFSTRPVEPTR